MQTRKRASRLLLMQRYIAKCKNVIAGKGGGTPSFVRLGSRELQVGHGLDLDLSGLGQRGHLDKGDRANCHKCARPTARTRVLAAGAFSSVLPHLTVWMKRRRDK